MVPTVPPRAMALEPITTATTDTPATSEIPSPTESPPARPHAELMEIFKHFWNTSLDVAVHNLYLLAQEDVRKGQDVLTHKHVILSKEPEPCPEK